MNTTHRKNHLPTLNELLALPVKVLGTRPPKRITGERQDLLRCDNGTFLIIHSRATGEIFDHIDFLAEAEAVRYFEDAAERLVVPPAVAVLLNRGQDRPGPAPAAPRRCKVQDVLGFPGVELLNAKAVQHEFVKRLDLVKCPGPVYVILHSDAQDRVRGHSAFFSEPEAQAMFERGDQAAPALPAALLQLLMPADE